MTKQKYDHEKLEQKWRQIWEEKGHYRISNDEVDPEKAMYILPQLPYPSGSGLHMGHSEVYTGTDVYARFQRMQGKEVLQVIGWDSFGLPAENYAIKTNVHPRKSTEDAIDNFREQIKLLGISVDWDREVGSHQPDYYKWSQWFFKLMYERGLAYRKSQTVNWCPHDKTVLANEQVENGECERCGNKIELREMEQWYFKITEYADRLMLDLDKVDWPEETVKRQRDWIGRSEGAEIDFQVVDGKGKDLGKLTVFTTAHDTIYGATFMVVAPEHQLVTGMQDQIENWDEVKTYVDAAANKTELERQQQKEKTGVAIQGIKAVNPVNGKEIPVFVADYVLGGYGTGAIMAVPAHDERDHEFAEKYNLDIIEVAEVEEFTSYAGGIKQKMGDYKVINSGEFDGMAFSEARPAILEKLEEMGNGRAKVEYKLRDWSVSRQRFWGSPIPVVYDPEGNPHLVDDADLPVMLPDDVDFKPTGQSPLTYSEAFHDGVEEKYGKGWKREVDTLDTFVCSSWYFFRYMDPKNTDAFASDKALKTWMPVDYYLGGPEHVNGHLLYSRFFTKVLYDAGIIDFDEPFLVHRHQGMIFGPDGKKMSKRRGNIVNPTDVVAEYGADTARMYLLFMGPLEQDKAWNMASVTGVRKFAQRVFDMHQNYSELGTESELPARAHKLIKFVTEATRDQRYNVVVAEFMKTINEYDQEAPSQAEWQIFVKLIAPYAPYLADEMWNSFGLSETVHHEMWPAYDESLLADEMVDVAIQINGKVRETIKLNKQAREVDAIKAVQANEKIKELIEGKEVVKAIYVPGRIVNLVIRD